MSLGGLGSLLPKTGGGAFDAGAAGSLGNLSSLGASDLSELGSLLPALAFANGGIMTSRGRLQLNRYAMGGVANSPQLAMFGEGRNPEAYVPLPDGRSIPVSMKTPYPVEARGNDQPRSYTHAPVYIT